MSLEQYKDASRKELWEILQIQVELIKKLEAKLQNTQADKLDAISKERKRWGREDLAALAIRDLEQRANGIMDARKANVRKKRTLGSMWTGGHIIQNMQLAEEELRRQVKALKAI
jgi:hypothetical protein